jgi:hypothetical protein
MNCWLIVVKFRMVGGIPVEFLNMDQSLKIRRSGNTLVH